MVAHGVPNWYREFLPNARFMYYNAAYLKLFMDGILEDGCEAMYVDSADVIFFESPHQFLDLLHIVDLVYTLDKPEQPDPPLPGFCSLFCMKPEDIFMANSGVFGLKVGEDSHRFFRLWKALCAWSMTYGYGDGTAFNLALSLYGGRSMTAAKSWNWLSGAYGSVAFGDDGRLRSVASGEEVHLLHGAGTGRQSFMEIAERLYGE